MLDAIASIRLLVLSSFFWISTWYTNYLFWFFSSFNIDTFTLHNLTYFVIDKIRHRKNILLFSAIGQLKFQVHFAIFSFLENLYKSHCQFGLHLGTIRVKIKLGVWQMYKDGAEIRSLHKFFDLYQIFHCQTKKAVRESWAKCRLEWQRETFFQIPNRKFQFHWILSFFRGPPLNIYFLSQLSRQYWH